MNKQFLLVVLFMLTLIGVVMAPPVQATNAQFTSPLNPGATVYRYKGETATAFSSTTTDGCIYTDLYLFAGETTSKRGPGAPMKGKSANLYLSQYDFCNWVWLSDAYGYTALDAANFQIDGNLNNAHLQSTITMSDWQTGNAFNLALDLTWTGNGDLTRSKSHYQYQSAGCKVKSRFNGAYRAASVTGSISNGTTDYMVNPLVFADLQSVKQGDMDIGCGW